MPFSDVSIVDFEQVSVVRDEVIRKSRKMMNLG